jgi:hypothetical protein
LKPIMPKNQVWSLRPEILQSANTVKPMHGVVPRVILGKAWWDATRQAAYKSTNYHCIACGVDKQNAREHRWLEGHEVYRTDYVRGKLIYLETVPLCHWCHNFIHDSRLQILLDKGEITREKFDAVMRHGKEVLRAANLKKKRHRVGRLAAWGDWRLVLLGKEYPPLFASYADWREHYK